MKKSTKILLIGGLLLVLIGGCILLISGTILGSKRIGQLMEDGHLSVSLGDDVDERLSLTIGDDVVIHLGNEADHEVKQSSGVGKEKIGTGEDVRNLAIAYGAGELKILESEDENIYLEVDHTMVFEYGIDKEKTLYIKPKKKKFTNATGEMILYLPKEIRFDWVNFELGAGEMTVSNIETAEMELSVGAGTVVLENLKCDTADVEVGAGEMEVKKGNVESLTLNLAMGEADLMLAGKEEDYDYDVSCGAGEVQIGSMYAGGLASEKDTDFGREKNIQVECAMGSVSIDFME